MDVELEVDYPLVNVELEWNPLVNIELEVDYQKYQDHSVSKTQGLNQRGLKST